MDSTGYGCIGDFKKTWEHPHNKTMIMPDLEMVINEEQNIGRFEDEARKLDIRGPTSLAVR